MSDNGSGLVSSSAPDDCKPSSGEGGRAAVAVHQEWPPDRALTVQELNRVVRAGGAIGEPDYGGTK